jgi:hypothetical protein
MQSRSDAHRKYQVGTIEAVANLFDPALLLDRLTYAKDVGRTISGITHCGALSK